jgi:hypothetical protein
MPNPIQKYVSMNLLILLLRNQSATTIRIITRLDPKALSKKDVVNKRPMTIDSAILVLSLRTKRIKEQLKTAANAFGIVQEAAEITIGERQIKIVTDVASFRDNRSSSADFKQKKATKKIMRNL